MQEALFIVLETKEHPPNTFHYKKNIYQGINNLSLRSLFYLEIKSLFHGLPVKSDITILVNGITCATRHADSFWPYNNTL